MALQVSWDYRQSEQQWGLTASRVKGSGHLDSIGLLAEFIIPLALLRCQVH